MKPKALLMQFPDTDLRKVVQEILSWHEKGVLSGSELARLAQRLVSDCKIDEDTTGLLQMAEGLALAEAARRFAEQQSEKTMCR